LSEELGALAALEGVKSCALVDSQSGLVWHAVGTEPAAEELWEAAIDYWRLHGRSHTHFAALGELGAAVLYHRHAMPCHAMPCHAVPCRAVLAIIPCAARSDLLVVCIASHQGMNWRDWQRRVRAMGERLNSL
jgi:hypothetical protein